MLKIGAINRGVAGNGRDLRAGRRQKITTQANGAEIAKARRPDAQAKPLLESRLLHLCVDERGSLKNGAAVRCRSGIAVDRQHGAQCHNRADFARSVIIRRGRGIEDQTQEVMRCHAGPGHRSQEPIAAIDLGQGARRAGGEGVASAGGDDQHAGATVQTGIAAGDAVTWTAARRPHER